MLFAIEILFFFFAALTVLMLLFSYNFSIQHCWCIYIYFFVLWFFVLFQVVHRWNHFISNAWKLKNSNNFDYLFYFFLSFPFFVAYHPKRISLFHFILENIVLCQSQRKKKLTWMMCLCYKPFCIQYYSNWWWQQI